MVTQQLVEYIRNELQQGTSPEKMKADLQSSGWLLQDIEEAYRSASGTPVIASPSPVEATQTKAPIVVRVIAFLMIIFGVFSLLASALLLFVTFSDGFDKTDWLLISLTGLTVVRGIGYIGISFGIRRMRRWALYAFTGLAVLSIIGDVLSMGSSQEETINASVDIVINVALLVYFWAISKKFIPKNNKV